SRRDATLEPTSCETSLQLDRVPPRRTTLQIPGTAAGMFGVVKDAERDAGLGFTPPLGFEHPAGIMPALECGQPIPAARERSGSSWSRRLALAFAFFSLLGQGEPGRIDSRFASPSALLATYWEALWANDDQTLAECFTD